MVRFLKGLLRLALYVPKNHHRPSFSSLKGGQDDGNSRVSPTGKAAYRHRRYQSELLELRHLPTQELHPSFHFYLFAKFGPVREFFFELYSLDTAGVYEWE